MNVIPSLPATEVARTRWSPELTTDGTTGHGEEAAPAARPATVALTRAGIAVRARTTYDARPAAASYGLEAAEALGCRRRRGCSRR